MGEETSPFLDRLVLHLTGGGRIVPLRGACIPIEVMHPIRGKLQYRLQPWLRIGVDGWIWRCEERMLDRHATARVLDSLSRLHPSQTLHLVCYPTSPSGQVPCWAIEKAAYGEADERSRASGLILGDRTGGWEAVTRHLSTLAAQSVSMRGSALRAFWREGLSFPALRSWVESSLEDHLPNGVSVHEWTRTWTGIWSAFAGASLPRLDKLFERTQQAPSELQDALWELGLAWLLNKPNPKAEHPWKGQAKPDTTKRGELFRRCWTLEDFPGLVGHPELIPLVQELLPIQPLAFRGMEAAAKAIPHGTTSWIQHLMVTALKEVIGTAIQQSEVHGYDAEDLFQEGLLGAIEAAYRYEAFDEDGVFRNFRAYANFWVWQRAQRYCQNYAHLIRLPVHAFEGTAAKGTAAPWDKEPEGLSMAQRLIPIVPMDAGFNDYIGHGGMTVLDVLDWGGAGARVRASGYMTHVADLAQASKIQTVEDVLESLKTHHIQTQVKKVIDTLSEREERVLRMRFGVGDDGEEHTLEEIGSEFAVTRERIRQIESKALRKIRHPRYSKTLKAFLDDDDSRPTQIQIQPNAVLRVLRPLLPGAPSENAPFPDVVKSERPKTLENDAASITWAVGVLAQRLGGPERVAERLQVPPVWVEGWMSGFKPHPTVFSKLKTLWDEVVEGRGEPEGSRLSEGIEGGAEQQEVENQFAMDGVG